MWLPFPISDDIIISLFLFFTNSFHNPSSIFDIYIGIYIVSISLLKVVCKLRMCNPNRCQYDSREFVVCCLNSFCIDGRCMTTTTTTLFVPTLYIVAMYVHIHFNHVTKAKALSLSMTIDIKDRYLFLPTCYCIKPHRTERWGMSNKRTSSLSLCTTTRELNNKNDDDQQGIL